MRWTSPPRRSAALVALAIITACGSAESGSSAPGPDAVRPSTSAPAPAAVLSGVDVDVHRDPG